MYLQYLNESEKEMFIVLAVKAAEVNGVVEDEEKALIDEYFYEMRLNRSLEDIISNTSLEELYNSIALSDPRNKRIIMFEIICLMHVDGYYDEAEKQFDVKHREKYVPAGVYESQAEKANELHSTGITFTIIGIAMFIFTFLNLIGVIPFFYKNIMTLCVLFALSVAAIGVGIGAFARSKKATAQSVDEEKLTATINEWLEKHAYIMTDGELDGSDGTPEELLYLDRIDAMKKALSTCFPKLDDDYVDSLLDEFYNKKFGA